MDQKTAQHLMKTLPNTTLLSYGVLAFPLAMLGLPLYMYLPTYYADIPGLTMTMIGSILMAARIIDMGADPLIGLMGDRLINRFVGPKTFILLGSSMLMISFYSLLHPLHGWEIPWLFLFSVLTYLGWSMMSIPYLALSAHLSPLYHEKTRLNGTREWFTILGGITAILLPYLSGTAQIPSKTLELLYGAFAAALVLALPFSLSLFAAPVKILDDSRRWASLWNALDKRLGIVFFINALANALPATLFLLYVDGCLNASGQTGWLLILYFVSGIAALPFWIAFAGRTSKRSAWISSMILAAIAFSATPFLGPGDLIIFAMVCIVSGFSLGADMALPSSIQADIASKHAHLSGALFGIWAMLTKLSLAIGVGIGFIILGLAGYNKEAPDQNDQLVLALLYGAFPVMLKCIAIAIMLMYKEDESTLKAYE